MQINLISAKTWREQVRETAREEDELEKDEKDIQQNAFRMKY